MSIAHTGKVGQSLDAANSKEVVENHREKEPISQNLERGITTKEPSDDPKQILLQSLWPTIAVYPSADTEELVRLKGIYGGFCDLLKPFGERVYGKVNVRDSTGGSRSWDDFGVHFITVNKHPEYVNEAQPGIKMESGDNDSRGKTTSAQSLLPLPFISRAYAPESPIDRIMQVHLRRSEAALVSQGPNKTDEDVNSLVSLNHAQYLRKVLAPRPMTPYDTFTHPVACLIVTSSQSPAPIEKLRNLYSESRHGDNRVPAWAGTEFLRYYVLVHDEDHDDIGRSITIYEQMKRHFGLHCHLLRLRSTECSSAAVDGNRFPSCTWSPLEDSILEVRQLGKQWMLLNTAWAYYF